jgi:penicillin-binding protein 1A
VNKLLRALGIVAAGALTCTGSVVALAFVTDGLVHHTAVAQVRSLPPLSSSLQEGSTVYAADGKTVLAVLKASQYRKPITIKQVSAVAIKAVLDTEDHRFYLHGGFDLPSTIRALAADSSGKGGLQGGSTITQQLVKQLYLTSQRTVSRKIKEAVIADRLARQYTKDQILQAYLNTIYLGNGAYGIEAAANLYFGIPASQLNLAQSALLAGMISNPSGYDPILQPATARDRRHAVLGHMVQYRDITQAQANAADAVPLPTKVIVPPVAGDQITDYYVQEVVTELLGSNSPLGSTYDQRYQSLFEGGLAIYTNLDPNLQSLAEQAVAEGTPNNTQGFQEAMVSIDPATGKVRAMVGGTGFSQNHYDVITQGTRQPGSGFKIFTLLAALEDGYSIYDTVDGQSPCAINFPSDSDLTVKPANNDEGNGGGVLTVQNATAQSTNCAFIRLAHEVGLQNVVDMAHRLGVSENLPLYPSIVIGSIPVHPLEMAAAYAAVADGGVYHKPSFIDHIVDRTGNTIYSGMDSGHRVISAQLDAEAVVALRAVVQYGTGTAAELYNREVAGKTGTTSFYTDAWFNGFTPQLEATVWMGNAGGDVSMTDVGGIAVYGGTYPTRTWRDFMAPALADQPAVPFPPLDYSILPYSKYITSPSLERDDVLDHNYVFVAPPPSSTTTTVPGTGSTSPSTSITSPSTVVTSPPTSSPVTVPGGNGNGNGKGNH